MLRHGVERAGKPAEFAFLDSLRMPSFIEAVAFGAVWTFRIVTIALGLYLPTCLCCRSGSCSNNAWGVDQDGLLWVFFPTIIPSGALASAYDNNTGTNAVNARRIVVAATMTKETPLLGGKSVV